VRPWPLETHAELVGRGIADPPPARLELYRNAGLTPAQVADLEEDLAAGRGGTRARIHAPVPRRRAQGLTTLACVCGSSAIANEFSAQEESAWRASHEAAVTAALATRAQPDPLAAGAQSACPECMVTMRPVPEGERCPECGRTIRHEPASHPEEFTGPHFPGA